MAATPALLVIITSLALMNLPAAAQPPAKLKSNRVVAAYIDRKQLGKLRNKRWLAVEPQP